jgi:hypothetical protein
MGKRLTRVVWWHYNKPATLAAGEVRLAIHWMGKCHAVRGVVCDVPCWSHPKKQQPRCVMKARANGVEIVGAIAFVR